MFRFHVTNRALFIVAALSSLVRSTSLGQLIPRSVQAGLPRAQEAGLQVSPFTTVNLYNGNATTVIPIVAWDPVGPPLVFNLYHNSASANSSGPTAPWGFDLGGGWTISYGAMIDYDGTIATLVEEDGNEWEYEENSGDFTPPAGKFDHLVYDDGDDTQATTSVAARAEAASTQSQ